MDTKDKKQYKVVKDTPYEDILRESRKGNILVFSVDPGEFRELSRDELKGLTKENILNYMIAKNACKDAREEEPPLPAFSINPKVVMAGDQLQVNGLSDKYHGCWVRPENVHKRQTIGYKVTQVGNGVETFNNHKSVGIVGTADHTELIHMHCLNETYEAIVKAAGEESRRRDGAIEDSAIEKMDRTGVKGVKVKE